MRVCYFHYEWDLEASTGAARQIAETVAGLERLGHQVQVIGRHSKPAGPNGNGRRRRRGGSWLWETANHLRSAWGILPETELLRRERPDVALVLHALRFSALPAGRRLGVPVVLQVNASVPDEMRRYRPDFHLAPGVSDWIERRMLGAADRSIVVSNVLRDYFVARGVQADRLAVVPNGADTTRFRPEAADRSWRQRFPGRVLVGFAGSFARFHGMELLEEAIAQVGEAHFVLAGDGPGAAALRARYGHDRVSFLGRVPHERVPGIVAAMDILAAPYAAQECFYFSPIKLFEYMASGPAVLGARLGQIAEVIENGRNGLLYEAGSAEDFVGKLRVLAGDASLRARLGAEARRTIEAGYTWDHNARRVEAVLARAQGVAAG